MARMTLHKVSDLARITGISVRTLHHYDAVGLLKPSDRSTAGYRLYDSASLLRLQQILIQKSLGFSLEHIRRVLDDPAFDIEGSLKVQLSELEVRANITAAMISSVKAALARLQTGRLEDTTTMKDIFEGFDPSVYEAEVKARWGNSDAYRESTLRTANYTPDEWKSIMAEQAAIFGDAAHALAKGTDPSDACVIEIAERHRLHLDRWYYACSLEMHCRLADLWEGDDRYRQFIDAHGKGVTEFLAAAIRVRTR
jgi:MerR family transcriptional regulator, thiopeptide resistance regulator